MPAGVMSKTSRTIFSSLESPILPVPNVSTKMETGSVTPIAYATWIWQRSASPAFTMFFAT